MKKLESLKQSQMAKILGGTSTWQANTSGTGKDGCPMTDHRKLTGDAAKPDQADPDSKPYDVVSR
jgi:hypothetical protein